MIENCSIADELDLGDTGNSFKVGVKDRFLVGVDSIVAVPEVVAKGVESLWK